MKICDISYFQVYFRGCRKISGIVFGVELLWIQLSLCVILPHAEEEGLIAVFLYRFY
jgi:hypothetical protein